MKECPVCGSQKTESSGKYRASSQTFAGMERRSCEVCGLRFAFPAPSESALADYNGSYFDNAHGGMAQSADEQAFFSGLAALRAEHLERYLKRFNITARNILEIGPGAGHFARYWLRKHPLAEYSAIETDVSCHAGLQDVGVKLLPEGCPLPEVDIAVLSHVLEHVSHPREFLGGIVSALRPGCVLFIEVPCNDWQHKTIDEPHLLFFDKSPMDILLKSLGLEEVHLSYHGRVIEEVQADNGCKRLLEKVRARLIRWGIVQPFARMTSGMEMLASPLERAVIEPSQAHVEQERPACWLRALATKKR